MVRRVNNTEPWWFESGWSTTRWLTTGDWIQLPDLGTATPPPSPTCIETDPAFTAREGGYRGKPGTGNSGEGR